MTGGWPTGGFGPPGGTPIYHDSSRPYITLRSILHGLGTIPGRKTVIVFSNNIISSKDSFSQNNPYILDPSVNVYHCALPGWRPVKSDLLEDTGGLGIHTKVDTFPEIERIFHDLDQSYFLGYVPVNKEMARKDQDLPMPVLHSLKIKVKKPGLKVRARARFSDVPASFKPVALPFVSGDVGISAIALPFLNPNKESIIRTMLHIDGEDISFQAEPEDGYRVTKMNIGCELRLDGRPRDSYSASFVLRVPVQEFKERVKQGFNTGFNIPVPGPGVYDLRITGYQTEARTVRTGKTSVLVEVPDFAHAGLAASGIATFSQNSVLKSDGLRITRRIRRSDLFTCSLYVYNAHREGPGSKVKLESQLRFYRDDKLIKATEMIPVSGCEADMISKGIPLGFDINPAAGLTAGNYLVEVLVYDRLADRKHGTAAQSVAIELVD
jgi:hypothetical protein